MTSNQIAYWNMKENMRANRAKEAEAERTNKANEEIKYGSLQESIRSHQVDEEERNRHNIATEDETKRHNVVDEGQKQIQTHANMISAQAKALDKGLLNWGLANVGAHQASQEASGVGLIPELVSGINKATSFKFWTNVLDSSNAGAFADAIGSKISKAFTPTWQNAKNKLNHDFD